MSTLANIVLADNAAANHTFQPVERNGATVVWETREAATVLGEKSITASFSRDKATRPTRRCEIRLAVPHEITDDGVVVVRDIARLSLSGIMPVGMTSTDLNHFAKYASNLVANAIINGYFKNDQVV